MDIIFSYNSYYIYFYKAYKRRFPRANLVYLFVKCGNACFAEKISAFADIISALSDKFQKSSPLATSSLSRTSGEAINLLGSI